MAELRHNGKLLTIHRNLGKLCGQETPRWRRWIEWDRIFGTGAVLFVGGAIGGAIGLIPFLALSPTHNETVAYIAAVVGVAFVGLILGTARMAVRKERVDSVGSVFEYVDEIRRAMRSDSPSERVRPRQDF